MPTLRLFKPAKVAVITQSEDAVENFEDIDFIVTSTPNLDLGRDHDFFLARYSFSVCARTNSEGITSEGVLISKVFLLVASGLTQK